MRIEKTAEELSERFGHTNENSCTTLMSRDYEDEALNTNQKDLRVCGVGQDAYFEWISEDGDTIDDMFYSLEISEYELKQIENIGRKNTIEIGHAFENQFDDAYRYNVPVTSKLILFLPVTSYRPEAMRVSERISENDKWYEVEIYNPNSKKWIEQKSHDSEAAAVCDATRWYPEPPPITN